MATLEQVFQEQKAWIAACDDPDAILDKIDEWLDDVREAEAHGRHLVRMRAGDLVELGRKRVVRLRAAALKAEERAQRPPEPPRAVAAAPPEPVRPVVRERVAEPVVDRQREASERRQREQAERAQEEEAKAAATRLANAQAAKIEADAAMVKAQAAALMQANARPAATTSPAAVPVRHERAQTPRPQPAPVRPTTSRAPPRAVTPPSPTAPPPAPVKPAAPAISAEDQLALMSVGRWPPSGPSPGHPFWSRDQDWPNDWTLTGFDLSRFRGRINVTQKVLATQLGVATAVIADLEKRPREKVGPAMQIALRRAMDIVEADERKRREAAAAERAARAAAPVVAVTEPAPAPAPPVSNVVEPACETVAPVAAAASAPITGADLARLRGERQLSQRQFAELLGVGHGMVAKAEVAASEPLGDRMREAVAAMLAAGRGGATR